MLKVFLLLFLVSNFCCKNFASASQQKNEELVDHHYYSAIIGDNEYVSVKESTVDELLQTLSTRANIKKLIVNFTLTPDADGIIKLFSGIGKMPALEVLEITRYRHFEISVTTQQVVAKMDIFLVNAAERLLAKKSSHKSYSAYNADDATDYNPSNLHTSDCDTGSSSSSHSQKQLSAPFFELEPGNNAYPNYDHCLRHTTDSLNSSTYEKNSETDCHYHDLIESLAKEEVKTCGEDFSRSFLELSSAETIEGFDKYIDYPEPDILNDAARAKTRKKLMYIFFAVKKQMEEKTHMRFHENGRGYIPSALAEAIKYGLFKNLKQLILPYQKHLSGAPFDEAAAIGWMRKILPGVPAVFAA